MKNITLTLTAFLFLFISSYAQELNYTTPPSENSITNENISFVTPSKSDILKIFLNETTQKDSNNTSSVHTKSLSDETQFAVTANGELVYNTTPITVNLSSGVNPNLETNVSYTRLQRVWRIEELGENTPPATMQIPMSAVSMNSEPGNYYMFISASATFDATADFQPLTLDENGNLEAEYKFNGVSFVTFGFAPKLIKQRAITFNGSSDYIDIQNKLNLNTSGFTISAWINSTLNQSSASIISKRDSEFSTGYDLKLTNENKVGMFWKNGSEQSLTSNTSIPNNQWHHIAVIFDGSLVSLYIDGVLDNSKTGTAPTETEAAFLIAAAGKDAPSQYFKGQIDEVRIWNTELNVEQLRFIMNQEITENAGLVNGKESQTLMSKDEINTVPWNDLAGYYPMSEFTFKNTLDASGNGNNGKLINLNTVSVQSAPLPYISQQNGNWDSSSTWVNGRVQYNPGYTSIVDPKVTIDWNIVKTSHNITVDNSNLPSSKNGNRALLALFVEANEIILTGDSQNHTGNGLIITNYLELSGTIDLEGDSQLIQTSDSDLNVLTSGKIERDQQGTADTFTYNYWSSPVTKQDASYNSFKVTDVMRDGTVSSNPESINFSSSGYNGAATSPITIADYWIWKYANQTSLNLSCWQHIRRTGTILPGEGFTMKGPGTGSIEAEQNYVFSGKPNNGDINLSLVANNDYLVGNPYPSAIDADLFIRDNGPEMLEDGTPNPNGTPTITGTLYFWKHWGGGSHTLNDYDGGYAIYNLSGAVAAATKGSNNTAFSGEGLTEEVPGRYIPVAQGFFVIGEGGGDIKFNNNQRVFNIEESDESQFFRATEVATSETTDAIDERMKFRIGFNSINTIHRQLLLTIDENATTGVDWAYDGKMNEDQIDDMFWVINDEKYIIQGSNDSELTSTYPIGIKTNTNGINSITIEDLENIPYDLNIYVHDIELDIYHDLKANDYEIFLNAGEYLNRFEITFGNNQALHISENTKDSIAIIYANDSDRIVLVNPNQIEVKSIAMYNLLGQSVYTTKAITKGEHSEYEVTNLSTGAYVIQLRTSNNVVMTKKVVVN
jgi:hypothetical protein